MAETSIEVDGFRCQFQGPGSCPVCHHAMVPIQRGGNRIERTGQLTLLQVVFKCPNWPCQSLFIATYRNSPQPRMPHAFSLADLQPRTPVPPEVPKEVADISPDYVTLMAQSVAAESYGLGEIAGTGHRKALEFLVKDYAISTAPDSAAAIRQLWIGTVIERYIADSNVNECAKRAAWLGNDETHYTRKWVDKDLVDLKRLLKLTQTWILSHLQTQAYLKDMPPPGPA